jgi:hypothetical protein
MNKKMMRIEFQYDDTPENTEYMENLQKLLTEAPSKSHNKSITLPNGNIVMRNQINDWK